MDDLNFEFAPTMGGDVTGMNDPVTTTFKGNISWSLARESIQNIIDAHDPQSNSPAEADFTLIERTADDLPKLKQLAEKLTACRNTYHTDKDAVKFYNSAIFKINTNQFIKILRISDYNTIGLTGDDNSSGNYFSFMKSVGATSKSDTEGGSFGLGKGAYYAASSFRTIFVSSVYDKNKYVFQGKSRLSSFKENDEWMQGNGSFGLKKQKPVRDKNLIPGLFEREDQGTDIYILGFEESNWEKQMIKSVLNFFWYSILIGRIKVKVGSTDINSDNLETLLTQYFDEDKVDKEDEPNPWPYYRAYTEIGKKVYEEKLPTLGKVKLSLLEKDNYPKKVALTRKTGMLIRRKFYNSINSYAGIFHCENEEGNKILRKMENSKHDEWESENASESELYEDAVKAQKELKDFINRSIKDMAGLTDSASARIGGLEEYLFLKGDEELGDTSLGINGRPTEGISEFETPPEIGSANEQVISQVPRIERVEAIAKEVTKGEVDGGTQPIIKDRKGKKSKSKGGTEGEAEKSVVVLKHIKYRSFAVKNEKMTDHILIIKGEPNTQFFAEVRAGTDDSYDTINILKVEDSQGNSYAVEQNFIKGLSTNQEGKLKLNLKFDTNERYSLNLTAYENK
jgi:hypothetical protein